MAKNLVLCTFLQEIRMPVNYLHVCTKWYSYFLGTACEKSVAEETNHHHQSVAIASQSISMPEVEDEELEGERHE